METNHYVVVSVLCFFFKQKTAYEMRISDWSSDVCSSDLPLRGRLAGGLDCVGIGERAHTVSTGRGRNRTIGRRRRGPRFGPRSEQPATQTRFSRPADYR